MKNLSSRFVRVSFGGRLVLLAALLSIMFASASWATLAGTTQVTAGNSVAVPFVSGAPQGTLVISQDVTFSYTPFGQPGSVTSGTVVEAVYREGGTLDFYYQIDNSAGSASAINRETDFDFAGFTTYVGYLETAGGPFATPTSAVSGVSGIPETADSSVAAGTTPAGATIGFNFNSPSTANVVSPGSDSAIFVISTNATNWTYGSVSLIDGGTDTILGLQPIPEPSYSILLGGGLLLLAGLRRKFSARQ